jgi:hypothetical protein
VGSYRTGQANFAWHLEQGTPWSSPPSTDPVYNLPSVAKPDFVAAMRMHQLAADQVFLTDIP